MPRKGNRKRLKNRIDNLSSHRVTVADFANSDPAVVKSGRLRKSLANAHQKEVKALCGVEASSTAIDDRDSVLSETGEQCDSNSEDYENPDESSFSKKKKKKRHQEIAILDSTGEYYPVDIWLLLAAYIRPEDVLTFALICKSSWIITCTTAFWMRLYKRYYQMNIYLPVRLLPECICRLRCMRACVIRSLYHLYEPFCSRVAKTAVIPDSTPSHLTNSKPPQKKRYYRDPLRPPSVYKDVHCNPDNDTFLLKVSTMNYIFIPVVLGMTLTLITINVSTDMRHHRVKLVFHDYVVRNGKKPRSDQGVQIILDPVHSVNLLNWWHPRFPFAYRD
uniref:Transmembrane protein 183A n=1 Tax=Leptobrachium leishanense TaxID=445787 RepID=A0A8C5LTL0_9ANUR